MKDKLLYSVIFSSFSYGFYRQWNCKYEEPNDLFSNKLALSIINGFIYIIPPICFFRYLRLLNRIEIKYLKKDPKKYKINYEELLFNNYKTY
jgi:hypothetical protein